MFSNSDPIRRLSNYRRVLCKLRALGFERFVSDNLGGALDISPAQVRKDFADYGLTGNKKGGYDVRDLIEKLNKILGKNELQKIIVVGCGGMGRTLMGYNGFSGEGMKVVAGFDSNPSLIDPRAIIPIYDINDMPEYIQKEKIELAIMTVPESAASKVSEVLKGCHIKGILNFAPIMLKSSEECIIRNINIIHEMENIIYFARKIGNED
ncbi:MAG: redox-sensing transcriptional repressor Rex [Victivallales bacterium]|nr:redox-sensing transcriptional repressor Rex [Victivallales bacterium]